jgi:phage tail-like protein
VKPNAEKPQGGNARGYSNAFFYVEIQGITNGVFAEVSGLQGEVEVFKYREGGFNNQAHMLPSAGTVSNLVLKRGMIKGNEFFMWWNKTLQGDISRRDAVVRMHDVNGEILFTWTLLQTYPCKWSGPSFSAKDNSVAIETIELAHEGFGDVTV